MNRKGKNSKIIKNEIHLTIAQKCEISSIPYTYLNRVKEDTIISLLKKKT